MPAVFIVTVWALFLKIYCLKISQRQSLKPIEIFTFHIKIKPLPQQKPFPVSFDTLVIKTFLKLININVHSQSKPSLQINLSASVSLSSAPRAAAAEAGRLPWHLFTTPSIRLLSLTPLRQQILQTTHRRSLARYDCSLHWSFQQPHGTEGEEEALRRGNSSLYLNIRW